MSTVQIDLLIGIFSLCAAAFLVWRWLLPKMTDNLYIWLAYVFIRLHLMARAGFYLKLVRSVEGLNPEYLSYYLMYQGIVAQAKNDLDTASYFYLRGIDEGKPGPHNVSLSYFALAQIAGRKGDWKKSGEYIQNAIKIPHDPKMDAKYHYAWNDISRHLSGQEESSV